jgi:hypothetical protein
MSDKSPIESDFLHVVTYDTKMVIPEGTTISKERAAYRVEREELEAAGLLDDDGEQILPTDCPATYHIADGTAAGWNGPLGDSVRCERPRGHYPPDGHMYTIKWEDDERPNRD